MGKKVDTGEICKNCGHNINYGWNSSYRGRYYHIAVEEGEYYPTTSLQCLEKGCDCCNPEYGEEDKRK